MNHSENLWTSRKKTFKNIPTEFQTFQKKFSAGVGYRCKLIRLTFSLTSQLFSYNVGFSHVNYEQNVADEDKQWW